MLHAKKLAFSELSIPKTDPASLEAF